MKTRIRGRFTLFGMVFLLVGAFLFLTSDLNAVNALHAALMPAALCVVAGLLLFSLGARTS